MVTAGKKYKYIVIKILYILFISLNPSLVAGSKKNHPVQPLSNPCPTPVHYPVHLPAADQVIRARLGVVMMNQIDQDTTGRTRWKFIGFTSK